MKSIYVHIPFCLSKCHYCDFYSLGMANREIPHFPYAAAVARETQSWRELLHGTPADPIFTLYFGGGTPSLLPLRALEQILEAIQGLRVLAPDAELSLEMNPKTAEPEKIRGFRQLGVTRMSLGVQSLEDHVLEKLVRAHSAAEALQSLEWILAQGFPAVSVDLMYGLPGQRLLDLRRTLKKLNPFPLKHLSAYELIVEEHTPFYEQQRRGRLGLPPGETVLEMHEEIMGFAEGKDMSAYEISNYSHPGHESRHNRAYWDYDSFLGLGAGAVSFLRFEDLSPQGRELFGAGEEQDIYGWRFTHPRDLKSYLEDPSPGNGQGLVEAISRPTAMAEFMMMGLRKRSGVCYGEFEAKFQEVFPQSFLQVIQKFEKRGLIKADEISCRLTPQGFLLSNEVLQDFL